MPYLLRCLCFVLYISAIVCDLIALILVIGLVNKKISISKKISKYDKFINKILRQYDSYITEAEHETSTKENAIKVRRAHRNTSPIHGLE